jgi:hypothetical protein
MQKEIDRGFTKGIIMSNSFHRLTVTPLRNRNNSFWMLNPHKWFLKTTIQLRIEADYPVKYKYEITSEGRVIKEGFITSSDPDDEIIFARCTGDRINVLYKMQGATKAHWIRFSCWVS